MRPVVIHWQHYRHVQDDGIVIEFWHATVVHGIQLRVEPAHAGQGFWALSGLVLEPWLHLHRSGVEKNPIVAMRHVARVLRGLAEHYGWWSNRPTRLRNGHRRVRR